MSVNDADPENNSPPTDVAHRTTAENPTGRAKTVMSATLLDDCHDPTGYIDVCNHDWSDVVGLITTVEAEDGEVFTSLELSPQKARKLARTLERQAAEVEAAAEMGEE